MGILGILLWGCDRENSRDGEDDHIKLGGGGESRRDLVGWDRGSY